MTETVLSTTHKPPSHEDDVLLDFCCWNLLAYCLGPTSDEPGFGFYPKPRGHD